MPSYKAVSLVKTVACYLPLTNSACDEKQNLSTLATSSHTTILTLNLHACNVCVCVCVCMLPYCIHVM